MSVSSAIAVPLNIVPTTNSIVSHASQQTLTMPSQAISSLNTLPNNGQPSLVASKQSFVFGNLPSQQNLQSVGIAGESDQVMENASQQPIVSVNLQTQQPAFVAQRPIFAFGSLPTQAQ